MAREIARVSILFCLATCGASLIAYAQENAVRNGGFEDVVGDRVSDWTCVSGQLDAGRDAGKSVQFTGALSQKGSMHVFQGKWYRFACWTRAEGVPTGVVGVTFLGNNNILVLSSQVPLRSQWQRFEVLFYAEHGADDNGVLEFSAGDAGAVWVDDVALVEVPFPAPKYTASTMRLDANNLIPNGSFECGPDGWSTLGTRTGWGPGLSGLYGDVVAEGAFHGRHCLRVMLGPAAPPMTTFNMYPVATTPQRRPLAANLGWIPAEKDQVYTLSAYMRADRLSVPVKMMLRFGSPLSAHRDLFNDDYDVYPFSAYPRYFTLTTEWKRYAFSVKAEDEYVFAAVGADMTSQGDRAATIWIDAVQLEKGESVKPFALREALEFGFDTGKFGNVFELGENPVLDVRAHSVSDTRVNQTLRVVVTDFFERPVLDTVHEIRVPGKHGASASWDLGIRNPGYYRARITWTANGRENVRDIRIAVVQPYGSDDSVFGVNHAPPTDIVCRQLRKAGIVWARDWSLNWQHLEPEPGRLSFDLSDPHVRRVTGTGMRMLCMAPPFPSSDWASEAPDEAERLWAPHSRIWWRQAYAPKDLDVFARWVKGVVGHYSDRVNAWEYLNEPLGHYITLPTGPPSHANYNVSDYIRLLTAWSAAVKEADPTATKVGGIGCEPGTLVDEFIQRGGLDYVDVMNIHIYPGLRRPEAFIHDMETLRRAMDAKGVRKPLWLTEYAYSGTDLRPWEPYCLGPMEWQPPLLQNEQELSNYSVRFAAIMLAHGVERIFYHYGGAMNSEANDHVEVLQSGILASEGQPRKLYAAQAALANMLGPHPVFVAALPKADAAKGLYGYAFQCDNRAVAIVWRADTAAAPGVWKLSGPTGSRASDIVGAPLGPDGLRLTESPVYLAHERLGANALAENCDFVQGP